MSDACHDTMDALPSTRDSRYRLCFEPLVREHPALSFPCDETGDVDLDAMSERAKLSYYYARTFIGREFHRPSVLQRLN